MVLVSMHTDHHRHQVTHVRVNIEHVEMVTLMVATSTAHVITMITDATMVTVVEMTMAEAAHFHGEAASQMVHQ